MSDRGLPFVLGGRPGRRPTRASLLAIGAVLAVVAIPLRGLFLSTGSSMEEAFMIVFPRLVGEGQVANADFLHLYGPFSLHVLTGWYWLFGDTLVAERVFGLLQHLGIIFGVYTLARAWGHRVAAMAAIVCTILVITPIGLSALSWQGGVALALWSVIFGLRAHHTAGRARTVALVAAGVLAGFALGYRPDLVLALGIAHGWLLWRSRSTRAWQPAAAGLGVGLVPLVVHVLMAGLGNAWRGMVTEPVVELRPGRELPSPPTSWRVDGALQAVNEGPLDAPWWKFPAPGAHHQLFVWFFVVILLAFGVAIGAHLLWRRAGRPTGRLQILAGASLFSFGMLPQALQRPDSTHLLFGCCVSLPLLGCLVAELVATRPALARGHLRPWMAAAALPGLMMLALFPFDASRYYLLQARISVGNKQGGYEVTRGDRNFYFGNQALQHSAQAVIDDLEELSQPGDRLLVGPADLSRTIYSDVAFYYLFPELVPATYFIEMDPGLADKEGSRLAADVASADWVLLTNYWTGWFEPNASIEFGSPAPNEVVAEQFCLVQNYDDALVLLYRRCEQGDGVDPSQIGIGADRRADFEAEKAKREAGQ